jgi:hypothetical protein
LFYPCVPGLGWREERETGEEVPGGTERAG